MLQIRMHDLNITNLDGFTQKTNDSEQLNKELPDEVLDEWNCSSYYPILVEDGNYTE